MITKLSHANIFVTDLDQAYDFYVNKLGFTVRTDAPMGPGARWLTVSPKDQPELEIILIPVPGYMFQGEDADKITELLKAGKLGAGVFETHDIQATYEDLKAKGVEFKSAPEKKFYGTEAIMKDNSGNWFSLTQRTDEKETSFEL